jgi:hypothetical protein
MQLQKMWRRNVAGGRRRITLEDPARRGQSLIGRWLGGEAHAELTRLLRWVLSFRCRDVRRNVSSVTLPPILDRKVVCTPRQW